MFVFLKFNFDWSQINGLWEVNQSLLKARGKNEGLRGIEFLVSEDQKTSNITVITVMEWRNNETSIKCVRRQEKYQGVLLIQTLQRRWNCSVISEISSESYAEVVEKKWRSSLSRSSSTSLKTKKGCYWSLQEKEGSMEVRQAIRGTFSIDISPQEERLRCETKT